MAEAARRFAAAGLCTALLPLLLGACATSSRLGTGEGEPLPLAAAAHCAIDPPDAAWLAAALARWQQAERDWLHLSPAVLPTVETADAHCTYRLPHGDASRMEAMPHNGSLTLAEREFGLGPVSFADGPDRFVMTLPSLWRAAGVDSEAGLERLMTGVLLHEIMHTRQAGIAAQAIAGMETASGLGDELSDDSVQAAFAANAEYVAAYEAERDRLFAAATAPDAATARTLARQALAMMQARRARWFVGDAAWMSEADDVFLTMEGAGQWLVYRDMSAADGAGLSPQAALAATRRGGRWWTQDEGLALMLVLDRLLPGWQQLAFREPDWRAANLLQRAIAND